MKIVIGNDRKGLDYKKRLSTYLTFQGYDVINIGTDEDIPCDYPIYAEKAGRLVANGLCQFGVLICSSGEGMVMCANKIKGVRCGLAYNDETAELIRMHNDANMIAFGQSFMSYEDVERRTMLFLKTVFCGSYHEVRVQQMNELQ